MGNGFPHLVRRHRIATGKTQQQVAVGIGVTNQRISGWERGADVPTRNIGTLARYAEAIGVGLEEMCRAAGVRERELLKWRERDVR